MNGSILTDLDKTADKILKSLPNGSTVKSADFVTVLGQDAANALNTVNATAVTRKGNHVKVDLAKALVHNDPAVTVDIASVVECDVTVVTGGVELRSIMGVRVAVVTPPLPKMDLKEVFASKDSSGNTAVTAHLQVSRFLPYVRHTVTVGPDGRPVK